MASDKILGALWILLGTVGCAWTTIGLIVLAVDPRYGLSSTFYEPSWWVSQALFPVFFLAMLIAGSGVLLKRQWALWAFRVLAPIMLVYMLAYTIFGGERAWWWALIGVGLLVLAGFSTHFAYAKRKVAAT